MVTPCTCICGCNDGTAHGVCLECRDRCPKAFEKGKESQRTQLIQAFKENKRTMAHIEGVKRVETDYVLLTDAIKLIEGKE